MGILGVIPSDDHREKEDDPSDPLWQSSQSSYWVGDSLPAIRKNAPGIADVHGGSPVIFT